jgi:hypothetical protein
MNILVVAQATTGWYNEVSKYNYRNPGFSMATGHFTQLVWKNTKSIGFGIAQKGSSYYIVSALKTYQKRVFLI